MPGHIHPNATISSTLLRISAFLCLPGYYFFTPHFLSEAMGMFFNIVLLIAAAYLIRAGYSWARWALLVLTVLNAILLAIALTLTVGSISYGEYFSLLQVAIQAAAVIVLFVPYKVPDDNIEDKY